MQKKSNLRKRKGNSFSLFLYCILGGVQENPSLVGNILANEAKTWF